MTVPLDASPSHLLYPLEIGNGRITFSDEAQPTLLRFATIDADARHYSDAQFYDYAQTLKQRQFRNRPPLTMTVRARFSHPASELRGTAGFGFWNQPFMPGQWMPRLPRYVWFFFGSLPSNMQLALDVPGYGFKAATLDMTRLPFLLLAPGTPLGFLLMRNPTLYRRLWPLAQRAIGAAEAPLTHDLRDWHTYRLDWRRDGASFYVDDALVLVTPYAPRGSLGFVVWIDNQFAVVTPQGQLGMGLLNIPGEQWMEIDHMQVLPTAPSR